MTNFIITGSADDILEFCAGPRQHNSHCGGWRFHLRMRDVCRAEIVAREECKKIIAAANARREMLEAAANALLQLAAE